MYKLLRNMNLVSNKRVLLFVAMSLNIFSEDTLELQALGKDKKKHEFKHELKGFDHKEAKDPLAEEEHFFHTAMEESILDDDEEEMKKDESEKDLMGFKNNHITVGMEVLTNATEKASMFNPFIQSFEVYKDIKISTSTIVIGAQGRRNRIESNRQNNLLSDDFLSGSAWHKNFSIESSHSQLDKQISKSCGELLDTRKERTRELKVECDLKEHIYTTISGSLFDQEVQEAKYFRKYRIFYGEAQAEFAYDSAYGEKNNSVNFIVGVMSDALNAQAYNTFILGLNDKFKFNDSKLEVDGGLKVGFNFANKSYTYDMGFTLKSSLDKVDLSGGFKVKDWHKRYRDILDDCDDVDCYLSGGYKTEQDIIIPLKVEYTGSQYFRGGGIFEYHIPTNMFIYEQKSDQDGAIAATQYTGNEPNWFSLGFDGALSFWKLDMSTGYTFRSLPKIAFAPAHIIDFKAEFIHAFFSASLLGKYKSEFYVEHDNKGTALPGYLTTDLEVSFDPIEHLTALFGIENLFDSAAQYKEGYPVEQRKFLVEVRFNF